MGKLPPGAQAFEQDRRQHGVAILTAFALFDAQRHALAVDACPEPVEGSLTFSDTTSLARKPAP